jgi:hypothetical protein
MSPKDQTLRIALRFGGIDGEHHKNWVIDQMVRALTGCEFNTNDVCVKESQEYKNFVEDAKYDEKGEDVYYWDCGKAP